MKSFKPAARPRALAIIAVLMMGFGVVFAKGVTQRIHFPRGSTSTVLEGSVVRGDRDRYILGAKAGQKMIVGITSEEDNAVFQIYQPGNKKTLDGAGEG